MMIEAMADGGVKMGLPRPIAYKLAAQTVLGAGTMVRETNFHPAQLKDDVSSPAGQNLRYYATFVSEDNFYSQSSECRRFPFDFLSTGSTITGIHYLERHGLRSALIGAIEAATLRCKEVSSQEEKN